MNVEFLQMHAMNTILKPVEQSAAAQPATAKSSIPADRISELYRGEIFTEETARIARDRIHWMCAQCDGEKVLDVGCSQGITAILLAREGLSVTAIDTHPEAIPFARQALEGETALVQSRITLIETDLASLPEEAAFDTIILGEVLEHQALPERFLRSAMTRLNPGGRLVITTPFALHPHPDHKISVLPRHLQEFAQNLGLEMKHLDVEDQYIRSVLLRPLQGRSVQSVVPDVLRMTEQATLESQRRLFGRLDQRSADLRKKTDALKIAQKKLGDTTAGVEAQARELAMKLEQARSRHEQELSKFRADQASLVSLRSEHQRTLSDLNRLKAEHERATAALVNTHQAAEQLLKQNLEGARAAVATLEEQRAGRDREIGTYTRRIAALEAAAVAAQNTASYRLGRTLVQGLKSGKGLMRLPVDLWGLGRDVLARRRSRSGGRISEGRLHDLIEQYKGGGLPAVRAKVDALRLGGSGLATVYTRLAKELQATEPTDSAEMARLAYAADPQPFRAKWLAFRLFEAGVISEPVQLLRGAATSAELSASELKRTDEIISLHRLQQQLPAWDERENPAYAPRPGSMLYVTATSLPYHTSGYSTRTQELLQALAAEGIEVHALTRPGYPWDRADRLAVPAASSTSVGPVSYHHLRHPAIGLPLDAYLREAAEAIKKEAVKRRVACIHAASNHVNALPALIAARELGIGFAYEMRGLWDWTRASRVRDYEKSERFQLSMALEAHCAVHADRVYVISGELRKQVVAWGVDSARIHLLPNCVNLSTIEATAASADTTERSGTLRLGYAGSILKYEGLDVLVDAIARLRSAGTVVSATLIGDGEALPALRERVRTLGLDDVVDLRGRLEPEAARKLLAQCDAVALPRLPQKVCEMIPPIKLVEAMALGKPVIVPDLPVFHEEVKDRRTCLMFKAGDASSLANVIRDLAIDPSRGAAIGQAARLHVAEHRTWDEFAGTIRQQLSNPRKRVVQLRRASPTTSTRDIAPLGAPGADLSTLLERYRSQGIEGLKAELFGAGSSLSGREKAARLMQIGKALSATGSVDAEYELALAAIQTHSSDQTLRGFFWAAQRSRRFEQACETIRKLEVLYGQTPTPAQQATLDKLKTSPAFQLSLLSLIVSQPTDSIRSEPRRVCYVLHNSLPYSSGGYGTRSHGVASGMRSAGYDVVVLTRPGFPVDIKPELDAADVPSEESIDGIRYVRTLEPSRGGKPMMVYVSQSADAIEKRLRELRPALVMAASNHVTALPALIAARRLGLPFIYEVRGLWEITRISRDNDFEDTPAFAIQKLLEANVARHADHVFTLTEPMREELVERGVAPTKIDLLPNSCDPERFVPRARDEALAQQLGLPNGVPVIGYVGTFVDYEGLEDLAAACALLKQQGVEFRLLLVGNENASGEDRGPITEQIRAVAANGGFTEWLMMPGRVPHEEVERFYSLIDIAPFPRKPWPVCEMVSPLKPLEALAMEKAVVVSSVRALTEMIHDQVSGLVFEKGDVASLAQTLERYIADPDLRRRTGQQGRRWVEEQRTWRHVGRRFDAVRRAMPALD